MYHKPKMSPILPFTECVYEPFFPCPNSRNLSFKTPHLHYSFFTLSFGFDFPEEPHPTLKVEYGLDPPNMDPPKFLPYNSP